MVGLMALGGAGAGAPAPTFASIVPNTATVDSTWSGVINGENFNAGGRTVTSARFFKAPTGPFVAITINPQTDTVLTGTTIPGTFSEDGGYLVLVTFSDLGEVDSGLTIFVDF